VPDRLAVGEAKGSDGVSPVAAGEHDQVRARYQRGGGVAPGGLASFGLPVELATPQRLARLDIEGDEVTPRTDGVDDVVVDRRGAYGTVARAVVADVHRSELVAPELTAVLDLEGGHEVHLAVGGHRDRHPVDDGDAGVAGAEAPNPGRGQSEVRVEDVAGRSAVLVRPPELRPVNRRAPGRGREQTEQQEPEPIEAGLL
jgi:hypothetical protein